MKRKLLHSILVALQTNVLAMIIAAIIFLVFVSLVFTSCSNQGGGSFDLVKFLQNPLVMLVGAVVVVIWLWKHQKK